jgi:hypothetical protein
MKRLLVLLLSGSLYLPTIVSAVPPVTFAPSVPFATGNNPVSVAVADLNSDGKRDIVTANYDASTASVLLGNGDGSFGAKTDFATGANPNSVAIADLNGDTKPDLVTANSAPSNTVSVLLGNGDGSFGVKTDFATDANPQSVAIADFDLNGSTDLAVANYDANTVSVLLGNGDGSFGAKTDFGAGRNPLSVAIGDLNGDDIPDMAVANYSFFNGSWWASVLLGNGDGTFAPTSHVQPGAVGLAAIAIGDLNGDVKADLIVTNIFNPWLASVLLGNGDGTFGQPNQNNIGAGPYSIAIADLNGDAKPDIATANYFNQDVEALLGNGDGTFETVVPFGAGNYPRSIAIGDLNGDGKPDLAAANAVGEGAANHTVSVLLNTTPCSPLSGMVAWWSLDEVDGSPVIRDRAGFNNQGTPRPSGWLGAGGPEPISGKVRGAVFFDSNFEQTGPHIEVAPHAELDFGASSFSIEAWVKGPGLGSIYLQPIVDKLDSSTGYSLSLINSVGFAAQIRFSIGDGVAGSQFQSNGTLPLDNTTWSHIAVTVDRVSNTVNLYLNGALDATYASIITGSIDNNLPVLIGEIRDLGSHQSALAVDELALYNRVLDAAEVQTIWAADVGGKCDIPTAIVEPKMAAATALHQNVPNPFNPTTTIRFDVPKDGAHVTLTVHDVSGRLVRTLVDTHRGAGQWSVQWSGDDDRGVRVASGVYFYQMRAGSFVQTRKMVLLK